MSDLLPSAARSDDQPSDERRERILHAALREFGRHGYAGATLTAIAARAGVSRSTLRRRFRSRDELFREVVRASVMGAIASRAVVRRPPALTVAEALQAVAHRAWGEGERHVLATIGRLVVAELPRFPELAVLHATEGLERALQSLERLIHDGVDRGELRPVDVRGAARIILATIVVHALWFEHPDIYGGVTGSDREHAMRSTLTALERLLSPVAS